MIQFTYLRVFHNMLELFIFNTALIILPLREFDKFTRT